VSYGTTAAYGSTSTPVTTLVTSHSVTLSGLNASTVYHYQVLSANSQGTVASSTDYTFTTAQLLLQIHADATEVSGVTTGSTITPSTTPSGLTGTVVVNGSGSVNYAAAEVGNGVYFQNCCNNTNNAYYHFTGAGVGTAFNVNQGQITFYLKSLYSFAQRVASASQPRYAFDVRDGNGNHLFYFLTQVTNGILYFTYLTAGTGQYYWVPQGTEDSVYGSGVTLQVMMSWNSGVANLYLNGMLVKSTTYTTPTANWSAASVFDLGAYEYQTFGGYNVSDDIIDEFTVTGPATGVDTTPSVVWLTAPAGGSTVSGTITVSANATDNVGVSSVQFQLDGVNLGAAITGSGPFYSTRWNTTTATSGMHTLAPIATTSPPPAAFRLRLTMC
jgi:hypothetical protein